MANGAHLPHHSNPATGRKCPRCPGGPAVIARPDRERALRSASNVCHGMASGSGMEGSLEGHMSAILGLGYSYLHV